MDFKGSLSPRIWRLFGALFGGCGVCFRPSHRGRRQFGWRGAKKPELAKVLCENSGADVGWLMDKFNLDLSLVARLGGLSALTEARNVSQEKTITCALIQTVEKIAEKADKAKIKTKARVTELIMSLRVCASLRK